MFPRALVTVCACMGARAEGPTAKLEQHRVGVSAWLCWGTEYTMDLFKSFFFIVVVCFCFKIIYLFFGCPESSLLCGLSSSFGMISGAVFSSGGVRASHCGTRTRQLQLRALEHRLSSCDTGLMSSAARGVFSDQGSQHLLHWQVNSLPLGPWEALLLSVFTRKDRQACA